jgi:hypothetical protein
MTLNFYLYPAFSKIFERLIAASSKERKQALR